MGSRPCFYPPEPRTADPSSTRREKQGNSRIQALQYFFCGANVVANVSNDAQEQELTYNLEQLESQKATNIFPSTVRRRANKGKASTLKIKNCSWFTDYHLLSYKDCLVKNKRIRDKK